MCAFTVMFFRADSVWWGKMPRAWPLMSTVTTSLCSMYQSHQESALLQTMDSGSHTMTCWNLWWDVHLHLGVFSYVNFLYFYGISLFFFINIDWYFVSFVLPLFLIFIFLLYTVLHLLFNCFVCFFFLLLVYTVLHLLFNCFVFFFLLIVS